MTLYGLEQGEAAPSVARSGVYQPCIITWDIYTQSVPFLAELPQIIANSAIPISGRLQNKIPYLFYHKKERGLFTHSVCREAIGHAIVASY